MSRSHLYRPMNRARPLGAVLLAALWAGAAIGLYLTAGAELLGGVPLQGPAAAFVDRASWALAIGALVVGGVATVHDVIIGRSPHRILRLAGAALLLVAGTLGVWDAMRITFRPGTPDATAAVPEREAPVVESAGVGVQRVLWTGAGLVGAAVLVAGGVAALRSHEGAA